MTRFCIRSQQCQIGHKVWPSEPSSWVDGLDRLTDVGVLQSVFVSVYCFKLRLSMQ